MINKNNSIFFEKITMKKTTFIIILITVFFSCTKPNIVFDDSISLEYQKALDTLINYDNYFIGEFNDELLVSTDFFSFGNSLGIVSSVQDSVYVKYFYSYRIKNSEKLKTPFLHFYKYESKDKLNSSNYLNYNKYKDFYSYFNLSQVEFMNLEKHDFKALKTRFLFQYIDYSQIVNNTGVEYSTSDLRQSPYSYNEFSIESIKEIQTPRKGIELTYSFNCNLLSNSKELIEVKNAKGRCRFFYSY